MRVPYELRVALRYLTARRKQAFISVISTISILGVTVGVMALFIALGLMTGLQGEIRSRILGATAHVFVFPAGGGNLRNEDRLAAEVRTLPGIAGVAPVVYGKCLVTSQGRSGFATIKGVEPAREGEVTEIGRQVREGSLQSLLSGDQDAIPPILLGHDLALSLAVVPGDIISLVVPEGRLSPLGMLPRRTRFRVAGTVRTVLYEFDSEWGYISLHEAQKVFLGGKDEVSQIEVRLKDIYAVDAASQAILERLGPEYLTQDWIQLNHSLFSALWLEKVAIGVTIGLIVAVAALNIVATLILMVMEKHKDIAVLVSMGASRASITRIFVLQGAIIGATGTFLGGSLGWLACFVLDRYRLLRIPADVYQVSYVPFRLLPGDAAVVLVGALVICLLAAIQPARTAARLDPAEAIRYE